jgi:hypothetical protein
MLTGKKITSDKKTIEPVQPVAEEDRTLHEQLLILRGKLEEKEVQIQDLKQDKEFLQSLVKRPEQL